MLCFLVAGLARQHQLDQKGVPVGRAEHLIAQLALIGTCLKARYEHHRHACPQLCFLKPLLKKAEKIENCSSDCLHIA